MTYFLIAVIVMAALSPLISMMPSKRQLQIANLRQKAALLGLQVHLRALPGAENSVAGGAGTRAGTRADLRPFYARRRQREDRKPATVAVYRRDTEGWSHAASAVRKARWTPAPLELTQLFSQLPTGVSYVCENLNEIGLFWDEQGPETDIEQVDEVLRKLLI